MNKDNFQTARAEAERECDGGRGVYCTCFAKGADWAREFLSAEMDKLKQDNLLALDIGARFADERDDLRTERLKLERFLGETIGRLPAQTTSSLIIERDDLRAENAKLREALSAVTSQDRTKGYPTGAEWRVVVDIVKAAV